MLGSLHNWKDTIIALATPPGTSAIGIIRISGPNTFSIINTLFPSKNLSQQPSHTVHVGWLIYNDKPLDEVVISLFKNPRSYTGENIAEISCHGSPYIIDNIIQACTELGARIAKPGEFTMRAFINGKLDLTQAEAVADMIASNTSASLQTAANSIRGGFSKTLKYLREELIKFSALIELELDFSQEDVEFANRSQLYKLINDLLHNVKALLQSFHLGNVIKHGVKVAIVGNPNVGKSTLLNTLLNEERAIVSEIAGTTRDTIEESLNINGILFRLIDTAGIRESNDTIEKIGVNRSLEKMQTADLILYMVDATSIDINTLQQWIKETKEKKYNYIIVINKIDAIKNEELQPVLNIDKKTIGISAKKKLAIQELIQLMYNKVVHENISTSATIITNARHYEALQQVYNALQDVKNGMNEKLSGDLLTINIKKCLHYLGEITGEITDKDQLDYIFNKFCIGK